MIHFCIQNLNDIRSLLSALTDKQYQYSSEILSGASIGQHVRHILEFYICLEQGLDTGKLNYDSRKRDIELENHAKSGIKAIDHIKATLANFRNDLQLILEGNFSQQEGSSLNITSSLYRELAYCLEHAIHHQALIKIGLKELNQEHLMDDWFGTAPATIRFRTAFSNVNTR